MSAPTEEEKRKPFLYRYFVKNSGSRKFEFLDSGWMDEVTKGRLRANCRISSMRSALRASNVLKDS